MDIMEGQISAGDLPNFSALMKLRMNEGAGKYSQRELQYVHKSGRVGKKMELIREDCGELQRMSNPKAVIAQMLCAGEKACPGEVEEWFQCVRGAVIRATPAAPPDYSPCLKYKNAAEKCGQKFVEAYTRAVSSDLFGKTK